MSYYLGMDAGGSTTLAVVTDGAGNVISSGTSGNGNHQIDYEVAEANLLLATKEALINANLTTEDITFAWFGIAGGDREKDFEILHSIIKKTNLSAYDISGDTMIALRAGTMQSDGIVVICGTGVNCAGRNAEHQFYQCGGFGYMYGDFGGGGDLCIEVFRAVIREWDGRGAKTLLTNLVLEMLEYDTVEAMFHDYLDHKKSVPKDLARVLFPAVEQGDKVAKAILEHQGIELGLSVQAVVNELEMHHDSFDVVLAGSVVTRGNNDIITDNIKAYANEVAPKANIVRLTVEPVVGAILLAMESANVDLNGNIYQKLSQITEVGVS